MTIEKTTASVNQQYTNPSMVSSPADSAKEKKRVRFAPFARVLLFTSDTPARHSIAQNRSGFRASVATRGGKTIPWITAYTANDPELKAPSPATEFIAGKVRKIRDAIQKRSTPEEYQGRGMRFDSIAPHLINAREGKTVDQSDPYAFLSRAFSEARRSDLAALRQKQVAIGKKLIKENYRGDFHGVEAMKGGKVSLLNIMLEGAGKLRWTGPFGDMSNPQ
jgi:hypothetical protein